MTCHPAGAAARTSMNAAACILRDARPGHYNQSIGALASLSPATHPRQFIDLPSPRRHLKHLLLLLTILAGSSSWLLRKLWRAYYGSTVPALPPCSLLISTGGDTLLANIVLARLYRIPNIFIGKRSPSASLGVDLIFTRSGKARAGHVVVLEIAPANISGHPAAPPHVPARTAAVLIGGESREYHFSNDDYTTLATQLNRFCHKHNLRLLLTTSRRTGADGERILREKLEPAYIADAVWYGSEPRPLLGEFCSQADIILCSEDSGSMLTETIHYGRPVIAFHPAGSQPDTKHANMLRQLAQRHVTFVAIAGLADTALGDIPVAIPGDTGIIAAAIQLLLDNSQSRVRP